MYPICVRVDSMLSDLTAISMNAMRSHVGIVAASFHTIGDARHETRTGTPARLVSPARRDVTRRPPPEFLAGLFPTPFDAALYPK